jgi:hypothetical protein
MGQAVWGYLWGNTQAGSYAMIAARPMHEFGTAPEQLAEVAVAARAHAAHNPGVSRESLGFPMPLPSRGSGRRFEVELNEFRDSPRPRFGRRSLLRHSCRVVRNCPFRTRLVRASGCGKLEGKCARSGSQGVELWLDSPSRRVSKNSADLSFSK